MVHEAPRTLRKKGATAPKGRCRSTGFSTCEATWHPDCNGNKKDDLVEIAGGESEDADGDGVPDECERRNGHRR